MSETEKPEGAFGEVSGYATSLAGRVCRKKEDALRAALTKAGAGSLSVHEVARRCSTFERNRWTTYCFDGRPILEIGPIEMEDKVEGLNVVWTASFKTRDLSHNVRITPDIGATLPKTPRKSQTFFADEDGRLTRSSKRQPEIPEVTRAEEAAEEAQKTGRFRVVAAAGA